MNKRNYFDLKDAGSGSILFILLQNAFVLLLTMLVMTGFRYSSNLGYVLTGLLELTFGLTVVIVCSISNINIFKASKITVKPSVKQIILAITLCFVCLFGFSQLTNCFYYTIRLLGYNSDISLTVSSFGSFLLQVVCVCAIPAFCEELLFRGLICGSLKKLGKWTSILLSAFLFMLMHGNPDQTIYQFALGVTLGYAFYMSGSLWVPIVIHFTNNFYVTILNYATTMSNNTESLTEAVTWADVLGMLYYAIIFAVVASFIIHFICKAIKKEKKEETQKATVLVDGAEVDAVIDELPTKEKKVVVPKYTIILMSISMLYLIAEWVTAFVEGVK